MAGNRPPSGFHKSLGSGESISGAKWDKGYSPYVEILAFTKAIPSITIICKWQQHQLLLSNSHSPLIHSESWLGPSATRNSDFSASLEGGCDHVRKFWPMIQNQMLYSMCRKFSLQGRERLSFLTFLFVL